MGFKQVIKKGVSFGFQPKRWLGVDHVASHGKACMDLAKKLLDTKVEPEVQAQQQAEAQALLQDQAALSSRARLAVALLTGYALAGTAGIAYAVFLVFIKFLLLPASVMLMVSLILFVYAVQEFMVYGQIRCGGQRLPLKTLISRLMLHRKASS